MCALLTYCCAVCVCLCVHVARNRQAYGTLSAWSYDLDSGNYELPVRLAIQLPPEVCRSTLFSVALLRLSHPTDLTALLSTVFQIKTQLLKQVRISYLAVLTSNAFNIPTLYPDIFKDLLVPRQKRLDM